MKVLIFSGGLGINNKVVDHRLSFNADSGITAFESAVDVLVDRTGGIITKRGSSLLRSGRFNSKFNIGDGSFYVVEKRENDSILFKAVPNVDGTLEFYGIISGLPRESKFDYVRIGDRILYCTGFQNGILKDDVSNQWTDQEWTGPDSDIKMVKPPVGTHIGMLSGRVLLSSYNELFYSEHGLIGLIDEAKNRVSIESDIIMVRPVQTGTFVSDTRAVYFLSGMDPNKWLCKKVLNFPAVQWGTEQDLVDPSDFGFDTSDLSALFATVNGPFVGFPNGTVKPFINKVLTMPDCDYQSGSLMIVDETMILQS